MRREMFIGVAVGALSAFLVPAEHASAQSARVAQLAQTGTASMRPMTYADLERLYLEGKISAKEYQKLLADIKSRPIAAPPPPSKPAPPQSAAQSPPKNPGAAAASLSTNRPPVAAVKTNQQDTISDVEAKMDALIRARQKATNTPPRTVTAGPKTKRDRLNDLLRLYIEGKISETELNERRAKIIAEPD